MGPGGTELKRNMEKQCHGGPVEWLCQAQIQDLVGRCQTILTQYNGRGTAGQQSLSVCEWSMGPPRG